MRGCLLTMIPERGLGNSFGHPRALRLAYHEWQMRRGFSILLLALLALAPVLPAFSGGEDSRLPACCRRHGAHHCAMRMALARHATEPGWNSPAHCPCWPEHAATSFAVESALVARGVAATPQRQQMFSASAQALDPLVGQRILLSSRGPPATPLR